MENFQSFTQRADSITGWLEKKVDGFWKTWEKRYFILENRVLREFEKEGDEKALITLNFDQISVEIDYLEDKNPEELYIGISGFESGLSIRSEHNGLLKRWLDALILNISESEGAKRKLSLSTNEKILRYPRISNLQFLATASNGDILLFTSKEASAKFQRKITFSKYDHVALILRYNTGQIAFLESTRDTGVQVLSWDTFTDLNWHYLYKKLVYRKLQGPKSSSFTNTLTSFISKVEGKKYSLNPSKFFSSSSEETFFCSELVASAYKYLSLLPKSCNTSSYLPVHFSDKKSLSLEGPFSLGPEHLIDFSL